MAGQVPNNQQPIQQAPAGMQLAYVPVMGMGGYSNGIDAEVNGIIPSLDLGTWVDMLEFCTSKGQMQSMLNRQLDKRKTAVRQLATIELQCRKLNEAIATWQ